jgi:SAM-dependent methyltransferase
VGLTYPEIRELLSARERGASFDRTLTIGRQNIYVRRAEARRLPSQPPPFGEHGEEFLCDLLGIRDLQSVDASDFEGATLIHDLNRPVAIEQEFDAVIDGGSLEHIFSVPVALANYMRALKVGGTLFISTTANNLCGHGFYQFSPELIFRALSRSQGFEIHRVLLIEHRYPGIELAPAKRVVSVCDPAETGGRIPLVSRRPVMVDVLAQKTRHLPEPFTDSPQQSDYAAQWRERDEQERAHHAPNRSTEPTSAFGTGRARPRRLMVPRRVIGMRQLVRASLRNGRFYRRADL